MAEKISLFQYKIQLNLQVLILNILENCNGNVKTNYPLKMTHAAFDYYTDLTDPFR
jgi:hypothetical protein